MEGGASILMSQPAEANEYLTMSATTQSDSNAQFQNDPSNVDPTFNPTYTTHVTTENKTKMITVSLNDTVKSYVKNQVAACEEWRSDAQFVNDAVIHYIDGGGSQNPIHEVVEGAEWTSEVMINARVTQTLFDEIETLVSNVHTEWATKQEFYICAFYNFIDAGMPKQEDRR